VPSLGADEIRVAIAENARALEVGGGPMALRDLTGRLLTDDAPTWIRALPSRGGVEVRTQYAGQARVLHAAAVRLSPVEGGVLRANGRAYPGAIEVSPEKDGLTAVNELPFEQYVAGAVKAEAGEQMPIEMLKAQAIVARTYAAYQRRLNAARLFHKIGRAHV